MSEAGIESRIRKLQGEIDETRALLAHYGKFKSLWNYPSRLNHVTEIGQTSGHTVPLESAESVAK